MFDFIDIKTIFLILHLFGIALGAGGAFFSDIIFLKSIRNAKVSSVEMSFMTLGSRAVTWGLVLLIISGIGLFALDPAHYASSSKFLAKMTIVVIIALNGVILHTVDLPFLRGMTRKHKVDRNKSYHRTRLLIGGVISGVSWSAAIVLGAFRSVPWNYETIMGLYLLVVLLSFVGAYHFKDHFVPEMK